MTTALPAAPGYQSIAALSGMVEGSPEYAEQRWSGPVSSRPAGHQPFSRTLRLDVPGSTETATQTAVARLNEILGLRSNWDSYGAKPIDSTAAVAALLWLYGIDRPGLPRRRSFLYPTARCNSNGTCTGSILKSAFSRPASPRVLSRTASNTRNRRGPWRKSAMRFDLSFTSSPCARAGSAERA